MYRIFCLLLLLQSCFMVLAEDRALIIGISDYVGQDNDIPGPDVDVRLMREIAQRLGFSQAQISTLQDGQASAGQIKTSMQQWLIEGTTAQDRVLFYYSGHGAQQLDSNGDEEDRCDEMLIGADGQTILDDEIQGLLNRIPAKEILVIIDSCFSGTATKSLYEDIKGKAWKNELICNNPSNNPSRDVGFFEAPKPLEVQNNPSANLPLIAISAAADSEVALGALQLGEGSAFTQALYQLLMSQGGPLSFVDIQSATSQNIRRRLEDADQAFRAHTPQLTGRNEWFQRDIYSFGRLEQSPQYPNTTSVATSQNYHQLFDRIINSRNFKVEMKASQGSYRLNEPIYFEILSYQSGYLSIFDYGASGNVTLIYPNQYNYQNYVNAGEIITVPGPRIGDFNFRATPPTGESRLLALVTAQPLHLLSEGPGKLGDIFKAFSPADAQVLASYFGTKDVGVSGAIQPPVAGTPNTSPTTSTSTTSTTISTTTSSTTTITSTFTGPPGGHGAADVRILIRP